MTFPSGSRNWAMTIMPMSVRGISVCAAHRRGLVERVGDARHLHVERRARRVHRGADAATDRSGAGGRDHAVVLRVVRVDVPAEQVAEETHLGAGIPRLNLPVDDARPRQLRGAGHGFRWRGLPRDRSLGRPGGFPRLGLGLGLGLAFLAFALGADFLRAAFFAISLLLYPGALATFVPPMPPEGNLSSFGSRAACGRSWSTRAGRAGRRASATRRRPRAGRTSTSGRSADRTCP